MKTIDKILTKAYSKYGAQMGRGNVGKNKFDKELQKDVPDTNEKVFDCRVVLDNGGYDKGRAYWGTGSELRVSYTKDLSYVNFYRKES